MTKEQFERIMKYADENEMTMWDYMVTRALQRNTLTPEMMTHLTDFFNLAIQEMQQVKPYLAKQMQKEADAFWSLLN